MAPETPRVRPPASAGVFATHFLKVSKRARVVVVVVVSRDTKDIEDLLSLRRCCTDNDVPLLFDEVYTGFRMAPGGAQEYYGVNSDIVVYGKTLGGGLANGVVCGPSRLMRRFDPTQARGVF